LAHGPKVGRCPDGIAFRINGLPPPPQQPALLQRRLRLESYLLVGRPAAAREYILGRLSELAEGGRLHRYVWNAGGQFKGKPWSDDHPTDAQVRQRAGKNPPTTKVCA